MEPTVIQVAHYKAAYSGNFIASLRALEKLLETQGVRMVYALPEGAREREWAQEMIGEGRDLEFLPVPCSFLRTLKVARSLIAKHRPTIIHTHFAHHQGAYIIASGLQGRGERPFVFCHAHSAPEDLGAPRNLIRRARFQLMRSRALIISSCPALRQEFVRWGAPPEVVDAIPNAIDVGRARYAARSCSEVRAELGIPTDATVFLLFAWNPHVKGLDFAVEAFRRISASSNGAGGGAVLVVVGQERAREFLLSRFGQVDSWLRLAPQVQAVGEYYQAADAFLSPSRSESHTYAPMEAMANGLYVIASDVPGQHYLLDAPESGAVLFPAGNVDALVESIEHYLTARPVHHREIVSRYAESCSVDNWTRQVLERYKRVGL